MIDTIQEIKMSEFRMLQEAMGSDSFQASSKPHWQYGDCFSCGSAFSIRNPNTSKSFCINCGTKWKVIPKKFGVYYNNNPVFK